MTTLKIEWKHLNVDGETCDRCYDTCENLYHEVKRLNKVLVPKNITIELIDTKLSAQDVVQSNTLLINDVPIENIIDVKVSTNYCESCSTIIGKDSYCRTVIFDGNEYEDIPAKAIRQAVYKVLGLEESSNEQKGQSCCCKGSNCC
jgi:hypothetical protein